MQAISAKLFSLSATVLFFAAMGLRLSVLLFNLSIGAVWVYYLLLGAGVVLLAVKAFKTVSYERAFHQRPSPWVHIAALLAALGFFVDFVHKCVDAYNFMENRVYQSAYFVIPICAVALFALISCLYFCAVAISYGNKGYDFRQLGLMHIVPLLWAIAQVLTVMDKSADVRSDVDSLLKILVYIFILGFFYCFSCEIESSKSVKPVTLFCADGFAYLSAGLFFSRAMLLAAGAKPFDYCDGITCAAIFLVSIYAFSFKISIDNKIVCKEI